MNEEYLKLKERQVDLMINAILVMLREQFNIHSIGPDAETKLADLLRFDILK